MIRNRQTAVWLGLRRRLLLDGAPVVPPAASYLLRATWTASDQTFTNAQVLDTTAEGVEDGSFTVIDTGAGQFDIVSNDLDTTGSSSQSTPRIRSTNGITRAIGTALMSNFSQDLTTTFNYPILFTTTATGAADTNSAGILLANPAILRLKLIGSGNVDVGTYSAATAYDYANILGGYNATGVPYKSGDTKANFTYGNSVYIKGGAYTNWTLLYRSELDNTATLYGAFHAYNGEGTLGRIVQPDVDLSSLLETNNLDTAVVTTDTFTHIADCLIEAKITTLPSSGNLDIEFRRQGDSNKWIYRATSAGAVSLVEVVAGGETTRIGPVAAAVSNGDIVRIIAEDTDITLFSGGTKDGTYAAAANFKTDTGGKIVFGSGAVAYLADWSRGTDAAYSDLDSY